MCSSSRVLLSPCFGKATDSTLPPPLTKRIINKPPHPSIERVCPPLQDVNKKQADPKFGKPFSLSVRCPLASCVNDAKFLLFGTLFGGWAPSSCAPSE